MRSNAPKRYAQLDAKQRDACVRDRTKCSIVELLSSRLVTFKDGLDTTAAVSCVLFEIYQHNAHLLEVYPTFIRYDIAPRLFDKINSAPFEDKEELRQQMNAPMLLAFEDVDQLDARDQNKFATILKSRLNREVYTLLTITDASKLTDLLSRYVMSGRVV